MPALGITFALGALLFWTFGDFFIQKGTREVGDWKTLFFIGLAGVVVLFPFIRGELLLLSPSHISLLTFAGIVIFFAALFDFEALRRGKLAVIEPVLGIELPVTVGLSTLIYGEALTPLQLTLTLITFVGIVLAVTINHKHLNYHKRIFEKGVVLAGVGAITMGLVNFLVGVSSQQTSALMAIWFTNAVFMLLCLIYLAAKGEVPHLLRDIKRHARTIISVSVLDNAAWISFAFATTLIPISIATTVSEAYIAFVVLLGLLMNRERVKRHQLIGIALAILGVILLSATTS